VEGRSKLKNGGKKAVTPFRGH